MPKLGCFASIIRGSLGTPGEPNNYRFHGMDARLHHRNQRACRIHPVKRYVQSLAPEERMPPPGPLPMQSRIYLGSVWQVEPGNRTEPSDFLLFAPLNAFLLIEDKFQPNPR